MRNIPATSGSSDARFARRRAARAAASIQCEPHACAGDDEQQRGCGADARYPWVVASMPMVSVFWMCQPHPTNNMPV